MQTPHARGQRHGGGAPFFMLEGNRCRCDIPEGTLITCEMMEPRPDSTLWALRKEQDEYFADMLDWHANTG